MLRVTIKTENAAFQPVDDDDDAGAAMGAELARILLRLSRRIADGVDVEDGEAITLLDSNGNRVGLAEVTV